MGANFSKVVSNIRGTTTYIPEEPSTEACMPNDYLWWQGPLLMDETFPRRGLCETHSEMPNGGLVSNDITSTLDIITMALTQSNIITLGVYGSSNAKKDIVVEKITRRVKRDNLFDLIVRASVMKKPDLKKIQGQLGNKLSLQICEKTLEGRARRLCDRIKMTSRILIILDDVCGQINLNQIGIPFGDNHNGCKILLISETQNVLSNQTDAQIEFTV